MRVREMMKEYDAKDEGKQSIYTNNFYIVTLKCTLLTLY